MAEYFIIKTNDKTKNNFQNHLHYLNIHKKNILLLVPLYPAIGAGGDNVSLVPYSILENIFSITWLRGKSTAKISLKNN